MGHTTAMFFRGLIATDSPCGLHRAFESAGSCPVAIAIRASSRSEFHRRSQGSASGRYALRSAFVSRAWA